MKLLFPNGEHSQVLLSSGVNRIGTAPDAQVVLTQAGVGGLHCEIQIQGDHATVSAPDPAHAVTVNGRAIGGPMSIRPGDLIGIGPVQARLVAVEKAVATVARPAAVDDSGATRVRMAVPKFVLRGVSGAAFGKTYPVPGPVVIGRQQDCDISIPSEEISRRHAQVKPSADGLLVEDLGSANGTFINGKRVQAGLMRPGEELRLDAIRFLLVAPGAEMPSGQQRIPTPPAAAKPQGGRIALVIGAVVVLAALATAGWYFFLR
ncbi:MAG: FHA domain-containing protein [Chiayiivirga sp.]|jgi:pSer/pThr/pTyr-binding forkhead associated (FHA) protein|uniref:FHA domain-containing protein n=1 Tax=Chiayiivirga sp. TaxID=2041042 RepID=UPI0025BBA1FF|nr:FHA domain-containing protein [Chiayiivirga sp.]MCI1709288.1 FHA domain-containing protein [Chiayiivirga sp.]MCI1730686.1 FHA domain-containing protein [Chiayiivirga sp.]